MQNFLLLFPPAVESAFFPYLSLPALTALLRSKGAAVKQVDLNLLFLENILHPEVTNLLRRQTLRSMNEAHRKVRLGLIDYIDSHPEIWKAATAKDFKIPIEEQNRAILVIKRALDLTLERSLLGLKSPDFTDAAESILTSTWGELYHADAGINALTRALVNIGEINTKPMVIGVSIPFYSQILPALACSKYFNEIDHDATIIWGGPQIWLHLEILKETKRLSHIVDALCYGQGEPTFEKICELSPGEFKKKPNIPNLVWTNKKYSIPNFSDQKFAKIDELPPPDFSDFDPSNYMNNERVYPMITCFGCYWGKCTFCSYGNRYHQASAYQELSVDVFVSHCIELINRYGAKKILFIDENCNLKLIARACRRIRAKGYKFSFTTRNRLEKSLLNIDFCRELKSLGCELMAIGYETNSQRLLDKLQKGVNKNDFQPILDNLSEAGIPVRMSVMGGILDETLEEMQASFNFLERNSHKAIIDSFQTMIVEPRTLLSDDSNANGIAVLGRVGTAWNEKTNFGLGRVGHSYAASSSRGSILPLSEAEILNKHYRELAADVTIQIGKQKKEKKGKIEDISCLEATLKPWVLLIAEGSTNPLICDMPTQRFFNLPDEVIIVSDTRLRAKTQRGMIQLGQVCRQLLATPIAESSMEN